MVKTVVGFFTPLVFVVALTVGLTVVVSAFFPFAPAADFLRGAFAAAFNVVFTFFLDTLFFGGVGVTLVAFDFSTGFDFDTFFAEVSA
ncbi:hypothetical protein N8946_01405 [Pseudomonadales bacterium]|nr:hypothetical protein [Pseudomonadales bacterium]